MLESLGKKSKTAVVSDWYKRTKLGRDCSSETHCRNCRPNGDCEACDSVDGQWFESIQEHAMTCDGCAELTERDLLIMDPVTQLSYCAECCDKLPKRVRCRLEFA